ncbi:hypothetical protein EDB80DRAFT_809474 [Ilyonectria destructans]|nr:hypothetical protein EDB80DRAFT_809474 [Ilyonectria destructans]
MIPRLACLFGVLSGLYSRGVSSAATTDSYHHSRIVEIDGIDTSNVTVFNCPPGTRGDASLESIQLAMNDFAYMFYTEKNVKAAFKQYVASNYVQHNPGIADGRDAAITALEPLFGSSDHGFNIARVMVGNEYTTIHIEATNKGGPSYNVFDVYRTKGTCIVEHWDCLEEISNKTVSSHPYF